VRPEAEGEMAIRLPSQLELVRTLEYGLIDVSFEKVRD
jgi:hypothetical protein